MTLSYNGKKLIPAPYVNIRKTYNRTSDNHMVGSVFELVITGKVFACKGSPMSSGSFWTSTGYPSDETSPDKFTSLLTKTEAIRRLFSEDGKSLEIQSWTGATPIKCYPIAKDISFKEGDWTEYVDYSITLEAPYMIGPMGDCEDFVVDNSFFTSSSGTLQFLNEASEDWSIELNEGYDGDSSKNTYRVTHNIKAAGMTAYNGDGLIAEPWQFAKDWVESRLGLNNSVVFSTGTFNIPAYYTGYNNTRTKNIDELNGSYSVTESWILSSGSALEEYTVNSKTSADTSIITVSIEGTINGLEVRDGYNDITTTKYDNANTKWSLLYAGSPVNDLYNRAKTISGYTTLNPTPLNTSVGRNKLLGSISYSFEYNTRPTCMISGAIYENLSIKDKNASQVFAEIPIPGRALGPILQDMNTISHVERTMTYEVVLPIYSGSNPTTAVLMNTMMTQSPKNTVGVLFTACESGLKLNYAQVFKADDNEDWSPFTGRYSRIATWVYQ